VTTGVIELFPSSGLALGPLFIGFYGLGYVVGVGVLLWVSQAEARHRGFDPSQVTSALLLVAACALVGARLYHVVDQWAIYQSDPIRIVLPPYSGLGLYGGIFGAVVGIWIYTRRKGIPIWTALDIMVPGTFLAQAIARWGNFFNQELYGPPTALPWGITIDCGHRVAQYPCDTFPATTTGFHPLFFYESILDLTGGLIALWLSRRHLDRLRDGDLASFWMIWYGGGRLLLETFRSGWNWTVGGLPTAMLIGSALVIAGAVTIIVRHRNPLADAPASP
jgi:phosphatidylglycerol:prolipoprotein diacylglycerol transferase